MRAFILAVLAVLLVMVFLGAAPRFATADPQAQPRYGTVPSDPDIPYWDLFNLVLDTLVSDYWSPDGNWDGDMMDDATTFAPEALFAWGYESGDADLVAMGEQTCLWELELLDAGFGGDAEALQEAAMGALALWWGYRYDVDPAFDTYARLLPPIVNLIAIPVAEAMADEYWPASTIVGFMAHIDNEVARYTRADERQRALDWAKELIDWAYAEQHDVGTGLFDDGYLMSNGVMLAATAQYARLANDAAMEQKARDLFNAMMTELHDGDRGAFWNEPGDNVKHFSKNLMAQRGLIALFELTGETVHRDAILDSLGWMKRDLLGEGLLEHHWTEGIGKAGYVCTGCNFLFLDNMLHWRRALSAQ